jgi:hypothetical protein
LDAVIEAVGYDNAAAPRIDAARLHELPWEGSPRTQFVKDVPILVSA